MNSGKLNNDIYTKASPEAIKNFHNILDNSKFKTFEDLSIFYKNLTYIEKYKYSNIDFEKSVYALGYVNNWYLKKVEQFKSLLLKVYNLAWYITKYENENYFAYFIYTNIYTSSWPLFEGAASTAYTFIYTSNDSSIGTYQLYSKDSFTKYKSEKYNAQYYNNIISTPVVINSISHEMGHSLDYFLGQTKQYEVIQKQNF